MATVEERFAELARLISGDGIELAPRRRGFGGGTLQVDGRIFAMVSGGRLVLKLPPGRVAALIDARAGEPFDAGKGRPLREWVAVIDADDAGWRSLAGEAAAFVAGRRGGGGARGERGGRAERGA